jgi:preprotein translocase subunit YajC
MISTLFLSFADGAAAPQTGMSPLNSLFPVVLFGVIIYFLMIRPQNQRQKQLQSLVAALKTGDKVVTNSGIHGIIANIKEGTTLSLKIADNVKIEIDKSAIATVVVDKSSDS